MKQPYAIKCKSTFLDKLINNVDVIKMSSTLGSTTNTDVYPTPFFGMEVFVDDTLDKDYDILYHEVPSIDEIKRSIETLRLSGMWFE